MSEMKKSLNFENADRRIPANSLTPAPVTWTPKLVERFWSLFSRSSLTKLSFGKLVGKDLVQFVSTQVSPPARLLDFGAGDGDLAEALLEEGYSVAVYEPSRGRREAILTKPLAQYPNFLGVFSEADGTLFDAVLAFEVLEHILPETLDSDMSTITRFLGPQGKLIGTVPLEEDLESNECICPVCDSIFHRWQHVRSFNHASLEDFLRKYGLRQVRTAATDFYSGLAFVGSFDEYVEIPSLSLSLPTLENNLQLLRASNLELEQNLQLVRTQLLDDESVLGWFDTPRRDLLRQNPKLFRLFVRFLTMLEWIPGLAFGRRAIRSIQRNGIRTFITNSVLSRLRRYMRKANCFIVCEMNIDAPFDIRWPDPSRFLPLKPISSSARKGKPSVCLITANMSAGGAERQVAALACELKKRGHKVRVRVMNLDGENSHYLSYLMEHGIDIAVPRTPGISDIKFLKQQGVDISLIKHLPAELRFNALALALDLLRNPVDIVHCYLDWCCCYGGFAALLSGTPCIRFSWRNVNPTHFEFFRDWMPMLYKFLLQFSHIRIENNTVFGASDYTQWLGLPPGKVEVIPNGIAPDFFSTSSNRCRATLRESMGIASNVPLVVSIGRLSAEKRPFDYVDILLALRKDLPSASLVHIGTGPIKQVLQERVTSVGLAGSPEKEKKDAAMFLMDRREDVFEILRASSVFLLTSAYEGMPNVVMEAMFTGVPVVATRVGGVPDLIQDGVHGFLHDVGDIAGMARSLARILTDPILRRRMGDAGRERILSEFTMEHLADRVTQAYVAHCSAVKQD